MFDYIIIGAGPGGLGLAYRLKTKDNKIGIIENDKWGGTCPNYGCDPTKMMMAVVEAKSRVEQLKGQGISGELNIDWKGLKSRKLNITDPYEKSTFTGLKNAGIETIYGSAAFNDQGKLEVEGKTYQAKTYIIATGSRPRLLDIDGKESQLQYDHQGKINVNSQTIIQETDDKEKTNIYNQLIVPAGKRSSITFTDGTCIWLSANSRIVYPVEFKQHKREIYIEGEAFLSVSHDPNRPFIVKTSQMDIQVLGTTFNVSAYENKQTQSVVLVSGKIKVKTSKNESKTLSPNNLLSYNEQEGIHIQSVDVQKYIAWKDGFYLFQTEKLKDIATKLSDYYGKKIMIDSPLKTITCSGKLDLKEDLDEVLQTLIRTVPARIEKSDGIIHIYVKH